MIFSGFSGYKTTVCPLPYIGIQRLMIALNLTDFDLTEGIEHYFRLAVSFTFELMSRGL